MKFISSIALLGIAFVGVEANKMYGGDLMVQDLHAYGILPKDLMMMTSTSGMNGTVKGIVTMSSSGASSEAMPAAGAGDEQLIRDDSEEGLAPMAASGKCSGKPKTNQQCDMDACLRAGGVCKTLNGQCVTNFPVKSPCRGCKCSRN